jgi:hypothetical protein
VIRISRKPYWRIPRSNSVSGGRSRRRAAIAPNAVSAPVRTTRARAVPLRTDVPMKTQFARSARLASAGAGPGCFSTG